MDFGVFYELQTPKPWTETSEHESFHQALEQIVVADRIGVDYAWCVEHHFLEEYSHSAAPEVFLAGAAAKTERIRIGHGVRHVIPNYNHPARVAEAMATLDLLSNGRVEFGFGEGATRHELHGFGIDAKRKRQLAIEAVEQISNMMTATPYLGYDGDGFSMPARNVIPKPMQKPHPPLWMACTNRDTIKVAASLGVGALAFAFVDQEEAQKWSQIYYDIIKSDACVPIGHAVNANIAMVSAFSLHNDPEVARQRAQYNFKFFAYAIGALVTHDHIPGHTTIWEDYERDGVPDEAASPGIGSPEQFIAHCERMRASGVDQMILMQQAGRNKHEHICESLELLGSDVLPVVQADREQQKARKAAELAPYIEAAMARKPAQPAVDKEEIPVIKASVVMPQTSGKV